MKRSTKKGTGDKMGKPVGSVSFQPKKDELFKRLKLNNFVSMILQAEMAKNEQKLLIDALRENNNTEAVCDVDLKELSSEQISQRSPTKVNRRQFTNVINGVGEKDEESADMVPSQRRQLSEKETTPVDVSRPFLLLDVRTDDEYQLGHIISAIHYPYTRLSRATNFESPELLVYKNKPGKLIIVSDDSERKAPMVAEALLQRGYDNVMLLNGGASLLLSKYPEGIITGTILDQNKPPSATFTEMAKRETLKMNFTNDDLVLLKAQLTKNLNPPPKSRLNKPTKAVSSRQNATTNHQKAISKPVWK